MAGFTLGAGVEMGVTGTTGRLSVLGSGTKKGLATGVTGAVFGISGVGIFTDSF
jgi:hypothetical protein